MNTMAKHLAHILYVLKVLELCYCAFLLRHKMLFHTLFFLTQNLSWPIQVK